jgi:PAS domain S-box-containing protein
LHVPCVRCLIDLLVDWQVENAEHIEGPNMNSPTPPAPDPAANDDGLGERFSAGERVDQLTLSNQELRQLHGRNVELFERLEDAAARSQSERDSRRAALNLMEDAVHSRLAEQRENAERRLVELALRKSEERYRRLFESINEGFCLIELFCDAAGELIDYRILETNPAFERHTGVKVTPPAAAPVTTQIVKTEDEPGDADVCRKIVLADHNRRFEVYLPSQNRWLEVHTSRLRDAGVQLVAAVSNDITDRKAAEEQLRHLNASLEERVQERTRELRENEEALRTAVATAQQTADRLRDLATQLTSAEQRTRRHVAQILHEHVQQLLVAARLRVELVEGTCADEETLTQLQAAIAIISDSIEAVRSLSVELAPPLLHNEGLPAALAWLVPRVEAQHGLEIELRVEEGANPPAEEYRNILFHAAREFLLNVVKHGNTTSARVHLSVSPGQIRLEVADRGSGFDRRALGNGTASFGLFHIRQRLEAIGGSLTIETSPGAGTQVTATLPVEGSESDSAHPKLAGEAAARHNRTRSGALAKPNGRARNGRPKSRKTSPADDGANGDV